MQSPSNAASSPPPSSGAPAAPVDISPVVERLGALVLNVASNQRTLNRSEQELRVELRELSQQNMRLMKDLETLSTALDVKFQNLFQRIQALENVSGTLFRMVNAAGGPSDMAAEVEALRIQVQDLRLVSPLSPVFSQDSLDAVDIEELSLTRTAENVLKRQGINTMYDLIDVLQYGTESLMDLKSVGPKLAREVTTAAQIWMAQRLVQYQASLVAGEVVGTVQRTHELAEPPADG